MSTAVKKLVDDFRSLSAQDQRDAVAMILDLSGILENPPLDVETLDRLAAESFLEYDECEARDAESRAR